jgi:hypothetical protein
VPRHPPLAQTHTIKFHAGLQHASDRSSLRASHTLWTYTSTSKRVVIMSLSYVASFGLVVNSNLITRGLLPAALAKAA